MLLLYNYEWCHQKRCKRRGSWAALTWTMLLKALSPLLAPRHRYVPHIPSDGLTMVGNRKDRGRFRGWMRFCCSWRKDTPKIFNKSTKVLLKLCRFTPYSLCCSQDCTCFFRLTSSLTSVPSDVNRICPISLFSSRYMEPFTHFWSTNPAKWDGFTIHGKKKQQGSTGSHQYWSVIVSFQDLKTFFCFLLLLSMERAKL